MECGPVPRGCGGRGWFLPLRVGAALCRQRGAGQRSAVPCQGAAAVRGSILALAGRSCSVPPARSVTVECGPVPRGCGGAE